MKHECIFRVSANRGIYRVMCRPACLREGSIYYVMHNRRKVTHAAFYAAMDAVQKAMTMAFEDLAQEIAERSGK